MKGKYPNGLASAMKKAGKGLSELARLASTTPQQIEKLRDGERKLSREWSERLAPHVEASPQELIFEEPAQIAPKSVPIVGTIGHDQTGEVIRRTDLGSVDLQIGGPGPWHALLVRGKEHEPAFRDGSLLIFSPVHHDLNELIAQECLIEIPDGRQFVKFLYPEKTQPGLWSLESDFNPRMPAQSVKWASPLRFTVISRMKPTGNLGESETS